MYKNVQAGCACQQTEIACRLRLVSQISCGRRSSLYISNSLQQRFRLKDRVNNSCTVTGYEALGRLVLSSQERDRGTSLRNSWELNRNHSVPVSGFKQLQLQWSEWKFVGVHLRHAKLGDLVSSAKLLL